MGPAFEGHERDGKQWHSQPKGKPHIKVDLQDENVWGLTRNSSHRLPPAARASVSQILMSSIGSQIRKRNIHKIPAAFIIP